MQCFLKDTTSGVSRCVYGVQSVAEPEIEARFPVSYSKLSPTILLLPLAFSSDFFLKEDTQISVFQHSLVFVSRRWFFSWMPG